MVKFTVQQAREFLEAINKKAKVAIITHDDADGIVSGILFKDFLGKINSKVFIFSYNKTKKISDLSEFDTVLIADLAPSLLKDIFLQVGNKKVLYVDHHPKDAEVAENILELRSSDQSPCSKLIYEICGGKEWLAVAGTISDAGDKYSSNMKFIEGFLQKEKISLEDYKKNYAFRLGSMLIFFDENPLKSFEKISDLNNYTEISKLNDYILPVESEISQTLKSFEKNKESLGNVTFFSFDPKYGIKSLLINKISFGNTKEIFVFLTPFEQIYRISFRAQSGKYDGVKLLSDCGAENVGGHPAACGGMIKKSFLDKFKENLKNYDVEKARVKN